MARRDVCFAGGGESEEASVKGAREGASTPVRRPSVPAQITEPRRVECKAVLVDWGGDLERNAKLRFKLARP